MRKVYTIKEMWAIGLIGVALLGGGCKRFENIGDPKGTLSHEYVGPLAYADVNVVDLINSENLTTGPDGVAALVDLEDKVLIAPGQYNTNTLGQVASPIRYDDTLYFGSKLWLQVFSAVYRVDSVALFWEIENSTGLRFNHVLEGMTASSAKSLPDRKLVLSGQLAGEVLPRSTIIERGTQNPLTPSITREVFYTKNSNAAQLFQSFYTQKVAMESRLARLGNGSGDWIEPGSKLVGRFGMQVPIDIWVQEAVVIDTTPVTVGDDTLSSGLVDKPGLKLSVDGGKLILKAENQFPMAFKSYIYLADASYNRIDSLHEGAEGFTVPAGVPDGTGRVREDQKGEARLEIAVDQAMADKINKTRYLIVIARLNTFDSQAGPPNTYQKFYSDYTMLVRLIGDIDLTSKF